MVFHCVGLGVKGGWLCAGEYPIVMFRCLLACHDWNCREENLVYMKKKKKSVRSLCNA